MYRVKLASGQERVYQSIDELTGAVQGGEVNGEALIYHQRADRWLSVTNHPHYQIATSRAQAQKNQPGADASRRQVVNAVRPSSSGIKVDPNIPSTAPRSQLLDVVEEMDKQHDASRQPKRVSIPNLKKLDEKSTPASGNLGANVQAKPPVAPPPANGNGQHGPAKSNGLPPKQQTTVLPQRAAPTTPAKPQVPDLGDEFELLDEEFGDIPARPKPKAETATPQVDKLLSLLEPGETIMPSKPAAAKPAPAPVASPVGGFKNIEFLDLSADHVKEISSLNHPAPHAEPALAHHQPLHVAKRRANRMPMMVGVAAVLVLGVGLVFWHPWNRAAEPTQTLAAAPAPRTDAFGGTSAVDTAASPSSTKQPAKDSAAPAARDSSRAIVQVAAPRINMKAPLPSGLAAMSLEQPTAIQIPAATLIQHYTTAYADARGEMEIRMLQIGFTQLFLKNRMTSASGVQDTRRLIAGASSALRQYRSQEQRIERAYQDTVGVNGRNLGWSPRDQGTWNIRPSSKETGETARLTNLMLSQVDAAFALLQEQDGKYTFAGDAIVFESPDAARQYGTLRAWINQQADNYAGTGDATLPATLRQVIKGIGSTRLPQERSR